jgi:hypothetical protein
MHDALFWWAGLHAVYFMVTGVWPIAHLHSFLAVTGPKTDLWLVKTVGVIVAVIGASVGLAAWRRNFPPETVVLAVGSAAGLATIDIVYVLKRVIARIYLLDAAAELVLIAGWLVLWRMS